MNLMGMDVCLLAGLSANFYIDSVLTRVVTSDFNENETIQVKFCTKA